jgi:hypothetical protein
METRVQDSASGCDSSELAARFRWFKTLYMSEPLASRSRASFCGARRRALMNQLDTYLSLGSCSVQ